MPAEWERQQSTLMGWPYNKNDWPGKFNNIPKIFAKIISKITKSQKVNLLINSRKSKNKIKKLLRKNNARVRNVKFIICETDRVWMRDIGPIFIKNQKNQNILLNWEFNGWAKYKNYRADNRVNLRIKDHYKGNVIKPKFNKKSIVLEGGAIDVNGKGLLITTKECLLSNIQQRNSFLKIKDYNHIFRKYFGAKKVIWLNKGIVGDDTHGHVDDIARFVKSNKVFLAYENNKKDENYKNLDENFKILKKIKIDSSQIKIRKIPMPRPIFIDKVRVPASYLNFYIFNKFVLLPTFNDPKDKIVIKIFKKEFNNRKIIPVDCSELIWGFGAIHCLTQQEPK
jgi:agmatine deiminase